MRVMSKLLALALAAALQPAMAAPVQVDFEDINGTSGPDRDGIFRLLDRYSASSLEFSGDAWGVASAANGCDGSYGFKSDSGCGAALVTGDPFTVPSGSSKTLKLNVLNGFVRGSSLDFSSLDSGMFITVYSGLDGTGDSTTFSGFGRSSSCTVSGFRFCNWNSLTLDFTGVAKSIFVTGQDARVMIDNLSFVSAPASSPSGLPEPSSIVLALGAIGALGVVRRRAAR